MTDYEQRSDGYASVEQYGGYTVYDNAGSKIGKVDDLFLDENDRPEYFGVKMGFFGTSSTLIPADIVTVDEARGSIEVSQPKDTVKNGPAFDDDHEITTEYENVVRSYYGLGPLAASGGAPGGYADYSAGAAGAQASGATTDYQGTAGNGGKVGPGMYEGDIESGKFVGHAEDNEGVAQTQGSDLEDRDELRVQRSEEELRAGTREREAGAMKVRKRVRVDRERIEVPVKREEVSVERVPVNEATTGAEIGEDEVSIPVTEEEVVVGKQAVVKEEVRIRKDVVQDTEVVEEDVRKEEVDVEDATERGQGTGR